MIGSPVAAFQACVEERARVAPEDSCTAERSCKVVSYFEALILLIKNFDAFLADFQGGTE